MGSAAIISTALNIVQEAVTVADATVEGADYRAPEGVGLIGTAGQGGRQGSLLAGTQCANLEIVQFLVIYILVEALIRSYSDLITAVARVVPEGSLNRIANDFKAAYQHDVSGRVARSRRIGRLRGACAHYCVGSLAGRSTGLLGDYSRCAGGGASVSCFPGAGCLTSISRLASVGCFPGVSYFRGIGAFRLWGASVAPIEALASGGSFIGDNG